MMDLGGKARFVMKRVDPNCIAVLVDDYGYCWPYTDFDHAREIARLARLPGFWRVKALKK